MRHAALTFAWTSWRQHHIALLLSMGCFLLASCVTAVIADPHPSPIREWVIMADFLIVIVAAIMCLLSVFSYGDYQADVWGRGSGFPTNQFRLPARTAALVAWPMAFGAIMPAALWIGVAWFV